MKFNADEIASVIQKEIEQYETELDVREVGIRFHCVGDNQWEGASGTSADCSASSSCDAGDAKDASEKKI